MSAVNKYRLKCWSHYSINFIITYLLATNFVSSYHQSGALSARSLPFKWLELTENWTVGIILYVNLIGPQAAQIFGGLHQTGEDLNREKDRVRENVFSLCLSVFELGHWSFPAFVLGLRLELTAEALLGIQLANFRSCNFSASIITWANSLFSLSLSILLILFLWRTQTNRGCMLSSPQWISFIISQPT